VEIFFPKRVSFFSKKEKLFPFTNDPYEIREREANPSELGDLEGTMTRAII